jgi:hypothetical protein
MRQFTILSARRAGLSALAVVAVIAGAATPIATASRARAAATPGCSTSKLVVWLDTNGNGAAGSVTYMIEFTNLTAHACTLGGFPGVSAISLNGHQLGNAAGQNRAIRARTVKIRPGKSAIATLKITEALNFPPASCHPVTAAGLRVFPPNSRRSKTIPFPFTACSRSGPVYLNVGPVQKS